MKHGLRIILAGCLTLSALGLGLGCSSSNNGGGGGSTSTCGGLGSSNLQQGNVDLAVADELDDEVSIFLNILGAADTAGTSGVPAPTPDIVLDSVGSGLSDPRAVVFSADDLYVGEESGSAISIFRDYATLSDGAAPDVVLDATADVNDPWEMIVTADDFLIVSDNGDDEVLLFADASAIVADVAPTAILDNAGSLIDNPLGLAAADGDLYVANTQNTAGNPLVAIFRDYATVASGDAPDARLNEDTSFFDTDVDARKVLVTDDDILYVSTDEQEIYVFEGASALVTNALPDAVIFGNESAIDNVMAMMHLHQFDDLVVGNGNFDQLVCTDGAGLVAFDNADALTTGADPSVVVDQGNSHIGFVFALAQGGGALFAAGNENNCQNFNSLFTNSIFIFRNVGGYGLCDSMQPNIVLTGTGLPNSEDFGAIADVAFPNGMAINELDAGT